MRNILFSSMLAGLFPLSVAIATTHSVDIIAHVPGCGDGLIQGGEQCDGGNLGGSTCVSLGFGSGSLSCSSACTFVTTSCSLDPVSPSSGGTRTRSPAVENQNTNLVVFGEAAPFSTVSLLKDGQRVASAPVGREGTFQMTVAGVGSGEHRVVLIVERIGYQFSISQPVSVRVVKNATTKVGPIITAPLVQYDVRGQELTISGFASPETAIAIKSEETVVSSLTTNGEGFFKMTLRVAPGDSVSLDVVSEGETVVSTRPFLVPVTLEDAPITTPATCAVRGDINADCKVNPVDFFITRFRVVEQLLSSRFDFNNDGKTDIVDFSIMAFNWTG